MVKKFLIKNRNTLFSIQWIGFSIFIVLTLIYYWDKEAHVYFNRSMETFDFQSIFSLIMTLLFAFFAVNVLLYPLLLLIQVYLMRHEKGKAKKILLLSVLYLLSLISLLALYTINSSQTIKTI